MREILLVLGKEKREVFCGGLREGYVKEVSRLGKASVMGLALS